MNKEELEELIEKTIIKEAKDGEYRLYTLWTSVKTLVFEYTEYSLYNSKTFYQWYKMQKEHWELNKDEPTDIDILVGNLETMYNSGVSIKDCSLIDHYTTILGALLN